MIIVTGAAGFIGSCIAKELNKNGRTDIIIVDELGLSDKWKNLVNIKYLDFIDKEEFFDRLPDLKDIELIIHMGACSSTIEKNNSYLMKNNFGFTKQLFDFCFQNKIRLIYASSAAVYGDGKLGYSDDKTDEYQPLNMYGYSKEIMDQYALEMAKAGRAPPQWVGLRLFNVYGPNEFHKGTMASVAMHSFNQYSKEKKIRLFKSHNPKYADGGQLRDFVYIKDVVKVILFLMKKPGVSGIFNVGTGRARSFKEFITPVFKSFGAKDNIEYIDMPEDIRPNYQYYTQADISKLRKAGYSESFTDVDEGVLDYVSNYLAKKRHYD